MLILLDSNITLETLLIAVVGYVIVFMALVLLFFFFSMLPKLINAKIKKRSAAQGIEISDNEQATGEEIAAISMALHLHFTAMHDEESGVLTIKKVSRAYSPWSSKIYGVRNQFNRR
jgi:glutaconyl-CoA/methylmalonyl-CoA decarboxylase subunit delta